MSDGYNVGGGSPQPNLGDLCSVPHRDGAGKFLGLALAMRWGHRVKLVGLWFAPASSVNVGDPSKHRV